MPLLLAAELRLWRAGMWVPDTPCLTGLLVPLPPLPPGHQNRPSHLNRLQTHRAPYSPGHLVFHLHLGGQEGQEVPRSQGDLVRKGVRLLPHPLGRPAQGKSWGAGKTDPPAPIEGALLLPQSPGQRINRKPV